MNQTDIGILSVGGEVAHTQVFERSSVAGKVGYTTLSPYYHIIKQRLDWKDPYTSWDGNVAYRQQVGDRGGFLKVYGKYTKAHFSYYQPTFTTAYDQYALRAFKVNSIDYILKPVDKTELAQALRKFQSSQTTGQPPSSLLTNLSEFMRMLTQKYKERFVIKVGERLRSIEVNDVQLFMSVEKTSFAQTSDGRKHMLDYTLDELQGLLDPKQFFRVNRKYIVAVSAIRDITSHSNSRLRLLLKVSHNDDIVVARERVQEFRAWLDR